MRAFIRPVSSPAEYQLATQVAEQLVGAQNVVRNLEPSMGAEDFSFMLQEKPGAYLRLGQGEQLADGQGGFTSGAGRRFLHHSCYDFNDSALPCLLELWSTRCPWKLPDFAIENIADCVSKYCAKSIFSQGFHA